MSRPKGTGCIYQRAGTSVWWIKYSRNGKPFCESSHTTDKRKAGKLLRTRLGEISTGTFLGPQIERVTIADLAEDFLSEYRANGRHSIGNAEARWNLHLKPFFGCLRVVEVSTPSLNRYVESRQQQQAKNATINRELAALKRMFNLGRANQKLRTVPVFPRLTENNVRQGYLEDGQYKKLLEYCPELWFRTAVELARTYGWRKAEVINMRVSQINLLQRTIRLEPGTTKNREGREVTLTEAAYTLLRECVIGKGLTDHVFTRPNGVPVRDFRKMWRSACIYAGLGKMVCRTCGETANGSECETCKKGGKPSGRLQYRGLIVHDLRRTAARNLRRAGVAEGVIQKIGGWKTRSVFERYAIVDQSDIADAMSKLQVSEQRAEQKAKEAQNGYSIGYSEPKPAPVAKAHTVN